MKNTKLLVVDSSYNPNRRSLRGPDGYSDSAHKHITKSGFIAGSDVVLISNVDFAKLSEASADALRMAQYYEELRRESSYCGYSIAAEKLMDEIIAKYEGK